MSILDGDTDGLIDPETLVCTFCGKKPVVGWTAAVDMEISGAFVHNALVENSLVAACEDHVSILQEQMEKAIKEADEVIIDDAEEDAEEDE